MNNTRFATAIHILTLLANQPQDWLSSEYIAGSININPVIVRKEIGHLKKMGLVESRKGKEGGVQLSKPSNKILLSDVYKAVNASHLLGKQNQQPNPKCPIGKQINTQLDGLFTETDLLVINSLQEKTLANFLDSFDS